MSFSISTTATHAKTLRSLHIPGKPLLLANVYSPASAELVAAHPSCRTVATASYALAQTISKADETLTLEDNLSLARPIAAIAAKHNLPFTVDIQDGYAPAGEYETLAENIKTFITDLGAAGFNLEDSWHETGEIMPEEEATQRIKTVLKTAKDLGVEEFVLNARSDTFLCGGELDESIKRGKRYLEAGATSVFIFWPREEEMRREDVKRVIDTFGGWVNVSCRLGGGWSTGELARMGAARVSVGPQLWAAEKGGRDRGMGEEEVWKVVRGRVEELFGGVGGSE